MQRTRDELEAMDHAELVSRVLEMQDMLREGLVVRDALHRVMNDLLKAKADEVERYADADLQTLGADERKLKEAWAKARHALSNPLGVAEALRRGEEVAH